MHKYYLILFSVLFLIDNCSYSETFYDSYTNIFGGELVKKYPNATTDKNECAKFIKEYVKNYDNLQQECRTIMINGKSTKVCTSPDSSNLGAEKLFYNLYCNPSQADKEALRTKYLSKEEKPRYEIYPFLSYHNSTDKSAFWIPKNINPVLKTDRELQQYRIFDVSKYKTIDIYVEEENKNNMPLSGGYEIIMEADSPFIKSKLAKAQTENRPFLFGDLLQANKDKETVISLKQEIIRLNNTECMGTNICDYNMKNCRPSCSNILLNETSKKKLKNILKEYDTSIFGDDFQQELSRFKERYAYACKSNGYKDDIFSESNGRGFNIGDHITPGQALGVTLGIINALK